MKPQQQGGEAEAQQRDDYCFIAAWLWSHSLMSSRSRHSNGRVRRLDAMRAGIVVNVTQDDRRRLKAIIRDRNAPQKHIWRAKIILATADGCGTAEIIRRSGKAKPAVWRWQERFMLEGVAGLTRDKTRKPGKPPLPTATVHIVRQFERADAVRRQLVGLKDAAKFADKLIDIAGLYVDPPEHAVVFSV